MESGGSETSVPSETGTWTEHDFGVGEILRVVPDAVLVGDASTGRVVLWNPAAAAMFGYEHDEGPDRLLIEDLVPATMREAHRAGITRLAAGEPTPLIDSESAVELQAVRKDGTEIWIELRLAHVVGRSRGSFALAVIRDISIRREAETAREAAVRDLTEIRGELEDRNRELDHAARTDHLTGLWNRRHIEEHLAAAFSSAQRHRRPVSLLLVDADEFKLVNERHGHPAGDRVLQEIAERMRSSVRAEDTIGRWGGEEFLVILPDTDQPVALAAAERLRAAVADDVIQMDDVELRVTVSVGIAGSTAPVRDELLQAADEALREAKRSGRNCVRAS